MNLQINNDSEVQKYQRIEREIFELDNFSVDLATFPRKLFKIKFDKYLIINTVDWFNSHDDYNRLINFLKLINSDSFIASCPPFYMVNAIKVPINESYENYIENHAYTNTEHKFTGVGIRKSPETFFYDESKKWAIVCDITTNITVIGLKNDVLENFKDSFNGHYKNLETFLENNTLSENLLEEFNSNY